MATLDTNFTSNILDSLSSKSNANSSVAESKGETLRYPYDIISSTTDYFKIEVLKYPRGGTGNKLSSLFDQGGITTGGAQDISDMVSGVADQTIILPIPKSINDSNAAGWREDQLNDLSAWLAANTGKLMGKSWNDLANADNREAWINENFKQPGGRSRANQVIDLIKAKAAAAVANVAGGNMSVESMLSRSTGRTIAQNEELIFKGVKMRGFDFKWDLAPRNQQEAIVVKNIIRTLKQKMAPKRAKTRTGFLNAPDIFRITYMTGANKHDFLNSFKPCALASMGVNYTGSGTYATYPDGTPVHLTLQLKFQELNPIYAEDYGEGGSFTLKGVGY